MRKSRFREEQIVAALKEHGAGAGELCRRLGISQETLYRWKGKYGGMEVSEARRLRALEEENRRLKRLVADQALDNQILKDALAKIGRAQPSPPGRALHARAVVGVGAAGLPGAASEPFEHSLPEASKGRCRVAREAAGTGRGKAPVRLPQAVRDAAPTGLGGKPQARLQVVQEERLAVRKRAHKRVARGRALYPIELRGHPIEYNMPSCLGSDPATTPGEDTAISHPRPQPFRGER